jgi:thiamine biosynthesis protein ThiS
MQITVNGEAREIESPATVAGLLEQMRIEPRTCAVELNLQVVPRAEHAARTLSDGDQLEIVTFVGGG